jgi:asparagine synthase (glutamine-hydrolysing)
MCGIFGMVGTLDPEHLAGVSASLAHRGPDAEGIFSDGTVTLLHRRLKVIDLSARAAQPMPNEDATIHVVFNGEIYNHKALRHELEQLGHQFRSNSDTEVIVHGFESWGTGVVERLDGMFAFGLWDGRRRALLLARDRAGKKPLFVTTAGGGARFASSIAALVASGVPAELAPEQLPFYLSYGFVPAPSTLYRGVQQLAPATWMMVDEQGRQTTQCYWRVRFGERERPDSFSAASEQVRQLVTAAVDRRLESDVPLGAFLSGGIDSTIIVGLMAKRLGSVRTFSIGFSDDARYDETSFARIASKAFGTNHTEFIVTANALEAIDELVRLHDGPFGDSSAIPTAIVSRLTRQHVTVALTGDGGDELFCGYHRFLAAEAAEWIPRSLIRSAARVASLTRPASERSTAGRAVRFLGAAALPLADRIARWNSFFPDVRAILSPDLANKLGASVEAPLRWQRSIIADAAARHPLSRVLEHNFRTYLPYDLLIKADRCSMGSSLETRSPFLDTSLIEYVSGLPASYLRRGTHMKRILKTAFADLLPPAISRRGKMGFGVPLSTWFRGELRDMVADRLNAKAQIFEYVDRRAAEKLMKEHLEGSADHGQRLWLLLTMQVWLDQLHSGARVTCAA